jgi:hypothetical protein
MQIEMIGTQMNADFQDSISPSPQPPWKREGVKKLKYSPSPYPLPPGERVNILKYKKKFPPP